MKEEGRRGVSKASFGNRKNIYHDYVPMSLYESGESNGEISIKDLFDNKELEIDGIISPMSIES